MSAPLIAVLAGGASTRMGSDKAFVRVADRHLIEWVFDAAEAVAETMVIGRLGSVLGRPAATDIIGGRKGPAAGLATALVRSSGPVVLLGCDQPWVRSETLSALLERCNGVPVIPEDEQWQVTCAAYPPSLAMSMTAAAREGRSIRSVLTAAEPEKGWSAWGEDGRSWFSADTPEAIERGIERFGYPGK